MQFKQQGAENMLLWKKKQALYNNDIWDILEKAQSSVNNFSSYLKLENIFQTLWDSNQVARKNHRWMWPVAPREPSLLEWEPLI